jgi:hypothetical protein
MTFNNVTAGGYTVWAAGYGEASSSASLTIRMLN